MLCEKWNLLPVDPFNEVDRLELAERCCVLLFPESEVERGLVQVCKSDRALSLFLIRESVGEACEVGADYAESAG